MAGIIFACGPFPITLSCRVYGTVSVIHRHNRAETAPGHWPLQYKPEVTMTPADTSVQRIWVGTVEQVPAGACLQVEAGGRSLGIFRVDGEFRAVLNHCPHQGAPLCQGIVRGTTLPSAPGSFHWGRENEILVCPWHGWEFSLRTGTCLTDRRRLAVFPVEEEDGQIFVLMRVQSSRL